MCFTQEVSALFAATMWIFAALWKGETGARLCVAYFALMETIQAAQYAVLAPNIDGEECKLWENRWLTYAGMVHLCFQPFFSNLFLMQFMTKAQKSHMRLILTLCLFGGVSMMNRFFVSDVDVKCTLGVEPLCGPRTCSFQGDTHVAWQMPLQHCDQDYFTPGFQMHFFLFFLPIFAMGMWRHSLYLLLTGPILGRLLTHHHDEIPAIWCFFSIVQIFGPLFYAWFLDNEKKEKDAVARHKKDDDAKDADEDQLDDVVGGWTGMARKVIVFTILLVLKKVAVESMFVKDGKYIDAAVGNMS